LRAPEADGGGGERRGGGGGGGAGDGVRPGAGGARGGTRLSPGAPRAGGGGGGAAPPAARPRTHPPVPAADRGVDRRGGGVSHGAGQRRGAGRGIDGKGAGLGPLPRGGGAASVGEYQGHPAAAVAPGGVGGGDGAGERGAAVDGRVPS